MKKCRYFDIKELVSKQVYKKFGEQAWMFFGPDEKDDLDTIREANGAGIIINNWATGGTLSQCGFRCNLDPLVISKTNIYCSSHMMGKGFDLHDSLGRNSRLYSIVEELIKHKKLKAFRRLESLNSTPGWVHVDSFDSDQIVFVP